MGKTVQFGNEKEYLNRLLSLARCSLQCTILEMGYDTEPGDQAEILEREEILAGLDNAYSAAQTAMQKGAFLPLEYLFWLFELDTFERHAVVLSLLVQMAPETAPAFAMVNGNGQINSATPCALSRTFDGHSEFTEKYRYFSKGSKLLKYFFCEDEVNADSKLTLDKRILDFVLGSQNTAYYYPIATLWSGEGQFIANKKVAERIVTYLRNGEDFGSHTIINFFGEKGGGRKSCIKHIARENGLNLMFVDYAALCAEKNPMNLIDKVVRECLIFHAIPVVLNYPEEMTTVNRAVVHYLFQAIIEHFDHSFVVTEERLIPNDFMEDVLIIAEEFGKMSLEEAVRLWELESKNYVVDQKVNFFELAGEFTLTPGKIIAAFRAANSIAALYGNGIITTSDLKRGCYSTLHWEMGSKAIKMDAIYTWDDLVLPQYQKNMLMTACNQVRYKYHVYQKWGFQEKISYGKNISMLFTGLPGTGKTMAAQVVAKELGLDLYKIELATVVSKYVGETEKNLNEIFNQAKKSQVILFFDEADVLFSKRTEVKDSNDKYSNMEAAFLLQKMEEYDGITILATNYIQNFDEAFKRRIKFVIDFPFPNCEQRREIWQKAFPSQLPLGELDYEYLTSKFELSGSNIKNIALFSAFLAAADGSETVEMKHILAAIRNEFAKSGKIFTKEDAGEYYILL